jgi:hypothetical protein
VAADPTEAPVPEPAAAVSAAAVTATPVTATVVTAAVGNDHFGHPNDQFGGPAPTGPAAGPLSEASIAQEMDLVFDRQVSDAGLPAGGTAGTPVPPADPAAIDRRRSAAGGGAAGGGGRAPAGSSPLGRKLVRLAAVPLDPFPDRLRDAVGKVAIVTTLNALAVLLYVLLFR